SSQSTFECCGVTDQGYRDWDQNLYFNCSKTNPSVERCCVPSSCCKPPDGDDIDTRLNRRFCGSGVLAGNDQLVWKKIYTRNCVDAIQSFVRAHTILVVVVGIVIFAVLTVLRCLATSVHDEIISLKQLYDRYYKKLDQGYPPQQARQEVAQEMTSTDKRLVMKKKGPKSYGNTALKVPPAPPQPLPQQQFSGKPAYGQGAGSLAATN
ncbi:hypothetical protein MTO96_023175, partial [Rhipicephalus appendiculatus]